MITASTSTISADRVSAYVDELRWFSTTYQLPWGKPEDLQLLCDHFAEEESFLIEFQAMIRSIIYRENCRATFADLLSIVQLAWGGPELSHLNEPLQTPPRDLAASLRAAMKFPQIQGLEPAEGADGRETSGETPGGDELQNGESPLDDEVFAVNHEQEGAPIVTSPLVTPTVPSRRVEPDASEDFRWWAESTAPDAFPKAAEDEDPALVTAPEAVQAINPPYADPWLNGSAFHQELLRFADRRREAVTRN